MSSQRALVIKAAKVAAVIPDAPVAKLRPGFVKVKTVAVALNPTDWKHIDGVGAPGCTIGCDYAGIVEEIGPDVTKPLKVGDKIAGFVHGGNADRPEDGTFAEHIVVHPSLAIKVPDNLPMEEAATLGVGVTTAGQGLYQSLGLPWPNAPAEKPFPILIYGGSTATGTLAIQYAKLSGLQVVTTCSPRNFDLVKSLGADHVFDYNSPTAGADILKVTNGEIAHVFDCISEGNSPAISAEAIGPKGGKYSALLQVDSPRKDVTSAMTLGYLAVGESFSKLGMEFKATAEDHEFASKFWSVTEDLFAQGKLKAHPVSLREGGLDGILDGLEELRQGKVSGKKLVYKI
ncbi:oxidoreductase-like protein [Annulohypoxylon truncatum]|uniref:oxidoreductase-like protein n=1 Tax=Annulohypoxylon truncatum TaxID=327061 RepID=UPI002007A28A|nr:oxidoreductase-like protein [Annulohypoxylon truncatum]KAI1213383.1 oxidoreductase-like protein [Annulohypoxylon truncatum]